MFSIVNCLSIIYRNIFDDRIYHELVKSYNCKVVTERVPLVIPHCVQCSSHSRGTLQKLSIYKRSVCILRGHKYLKKKLSTQLFYMMIVMIVVISGLESNAACCDMLYCDATCCDATCCVVTRRVVTQYVVTLCIIMRYSDTLHVTHRSRWSLM